MLRVVSLGAGVQSTTIVLMATVGEIAPMPTAAVFADTQAEPKAVYEHLKWLMEPGRLAFPVHVVTAGNLSEQVASERPTGKYLRVDIPVFAKDALGKVGIINRSCTRDFKIRPITRACRSIVGVAALKAWRTRYRNELKVLAAYERASSAWRKAQKRAKQEHRSFRDPAPAFPQAEWDRMQADALIEQWIGISLDEAHRMKPSREAWIVCRWPLIEQRMRRSDCLRWMERNQHPRPPKSACIFCPFHGTDQWQALTPEEFTSAVEIDRRLRSRAPEAYRAKGVLYLHRSCVPLDQVDFSTSEQRGQQSMFGNECEGVCGV